MLGRGGRGVVVYFLKYYIFILNPSGRSLLWLCTRRYSRLEREASDNPGSVCVWSTKSVDPSMVPMTEKLDWDGLRDPLKSCILPFPAGRYFSHPVASALRGRLLFRQVKISCYSTKGNERGQSARLVTRPGKKKRRTMDAVHNSVSGQGGGGSTRNGERETDRKGKVV